MGLRKRLLLALLLLSPLALNGCGIDLGVFDENEDGYKSLYESFGKVESLYDGGSHSYKIEDSLFNSHTVEEFKCEDENDDVAEEQYLYLIFPFKKQLRVESIVLFFYSEENVTFDISTFYFVSEDYAPKKIKYLSSPDTEEFEDEEGHKQEVPIEYDDPATSLSMTYSTMSLIRQDWDSIVFGDFKQEGYNDGYLHTGEDSLLYIRIENNSGFNRDTMEPVTLKFINFMVRAI